MSAQPVFIGVPKAWVAQITAANTARDGTGTLVTVAGPAGADGLRIDQIEIQAAGTTTAGVVRLFIHDGTNARLWREISISAITPSGTVLAFRDIVTPIEGLCLPSGFSLKAATHLAETFNIIARGGDF